jgi:hypothetical protein
MPDLQSLYLETLDCSLGALTESEVMLIPLQEIHSIFERSSKLGCLFSRVILVEALFSGNGWSILAGDQPSNELLISSAK